MKRAIILFFLACSLASAQWDVFPLVDTNTLYDRRIISNLVYAINERCAVVPDVDPLDAAAMTNGFITRAKLDLIDGKIDELIPYFIDRSFVTNFGGESVYNNWYRKYNAGLSIYNFTLDAGVTQGLPRLNKPQAFLQDGVGTNIWPIAAWYDQITNYPPYQTTEDRATTYLCRPEWTLIPGKPTVSVIGEWKYIKYKYDLAPVGTNPPVGTNAQFWIDSRLNQIAGNALNISNYHSAALPARALPYMGRFYNNDETSCYPYVQYFTTNSFPDPVNGWVSGLAYRNYGDLYRQEIITNTTVDHLPVIWPPPGSEYEYLTNLYITTTTSKGAFYDPANPATPVTPDGLPVAGGTYPGPQVGDYVRIWYEIPVLTTYSGQEPYSARSNEWANILWKECLNERYRIIDAMRWTTVSQSGGSNYWLCVTAAVGSCSTPFLDAGWPAITNVFPIMAAVDQVDACPLPVNRWTVADFGVFAGWVDYGITNIFGITNICTPDMTAGDQYPRSIYDISGNVSLESSYYVGSFWPNLVEVDEGVLFHWQITGLQTHIEDTSEIEIDFAQSKPVATVGATVTNYAYEVDFYMRGSNSILSGIDDPEFLPLKTQTVSGAIGQTAVTGATVSASFPVFIFDFPASVTSIITQIGSCPASLRDMTNLVNVTTDVSRAATEICNTQAVTLTNMVFSDWQYISNNYYDVLDAGRTNRFENQYYRAVYDPTNWVIQTNAVACYWYVTNSVIADDPLIPVIPSALLTQDPDPVFVYSNITVASNSLLPWDYLMNIVGFYPTGQTHIVDGNTNGTGDVLGDLYLTVFAFDPFPSPGAWITYSNDFIYEYFQQTPAYSQTNSALFSPHSNTWTVVADWTDYTATNYAMSSYDKYYQTTIAFSNTITNAWIMQWEPVIRWDVSPNGFRFVTP
jgi:hypothetical protein